MRTGAVVLLALGCLGSCVYGYGPRSIAQLMMIWTAYQLDDLYHPDGYTIAAGCGSNLGRRCTMSELISYIWKAGPEPESKNPPNAVDSRPTPDDVDKASNKFSWDPQKLPVSRAFARLNQASTKLASVKTINKPLSGISGNIEAANIVEGSTDFDDMLSRVGKTIGNVGDYYWQLSQDAAEKANAEIDKENKDLPPDQQKKKVFPKLADVGGEAVAALIRAGADSSQLVVDTRWENMDLWRITRGGLQNYLKTGPVQTKRQKGIQATWDTFDRQKTIDAMVQLGQDADVATKAVDDALATYYTTGDKPPKHKATIDASMQSRRDAHGCFKAFKAGSAYA